LVPGHTIVGIVVDHQQRGRDAVAMKTGEFSMNGRGPVVCEENEEVWRKDCLTPGIFLHTAICELEI
jgi:hypothetical protein